MHIINGDAPGQGAPGRSKSAHPKEKSAWLLDTAKADCKVPNGCILFPAEFFSKRAAAKYVELVRKAAKVGAVVDLVYGPFKRRPVYVIRRGNLERRLEDAEAASRWLETISSRPEVSNGL